MSSVSQGDILSKAIVLYIGYNLTPFPWEDVSRLVPVFGEQEAQELERKILKIYKILDKQRPNFKEQTLSEAASLAVSRVSSVYPNLNIEAINALKWSYSYSSR